MTRSETDGELQAVISGNFNSLSDCGIVKAPTSVTLADKAGIVQAIALHHVIYRSRTELDQFAEGMYSCGVLQAIRSYPRLTRNFFTIEGHPKLTSGKKICGTCLEP